MTGSVPSQGARWSRACLGLAALLGSLALGGGGAHANGGAKYDFRAFPTIGTTTTTFRVTFSAPFRTDGVETDYTLEATGPRRCPNIFEFTLLPIRRGERVVMRLTPFDDLYFNYRRTWCRGSYVGYVYYTAPIDKPDKVIGYFRFGVGRAPVSLEP